MTKSQDYLRGITLMLFADVCFALMAALTKSAGARVPAVQIVFIRSALTTLILIPIMLRGRISLIGKSPWILWSRGIVGYTALQLYFWALPQMHLGTAVMLNYTAPIYAVLIAFLFLKDTPTPLGRLCLAGAFLGVFLLTGPQLPVSQWAVAAAAASGLLAGIVHVLIRYSPTDESPLTIIFYFAAVSAMGSGALSFREGWVWTSPVDGLSLGLITITSLLGQLGLTLSLRTAPVSTVSPYGYLTPVFGLLIGRFLWHEPLTIPAMAGGLLIIGCGILVLREKSRLKITPPYPANPGS